MTERPDTLGTSVLDAHGHATTMRRIRSAFGVFAAVLLIGTVGYTMLGASPLDALYMTVITVFTVGYREVIEITPAAEVFTMGLIVAGFGAGSYVAVTGVAFVVEGHLANELGRRRMQREIENLRDHVIVCGMGRVGRQVVAELADEHDDFVIVDVSAERTRLVSLPDAPVVLGDASSDDVLHEAGVSRARAVVAAVDDDADNVLIALTAKGINPSVNVIARAKVVENERKLLRAGADRVISPTSIGGRRIGQLLTRPVLAEFLDDLSGQSMDTAMEELVVTNAGGLAGSTLAGAELRRRYHVTVMAIRPAGSNQLELLPDPDRVLEAGDVLVVMGGDSDCERVREEQLSQR